MHQNCHFLIHLTEALRPKVVGLRFMACFSQEKDELVIIFAQARGKHNYYRPFYIRATVRPDFTCLNFPDDFSRARQNSADLFEILYDLEVIGIRQFLNERALGLELENGYTLVFKLFGNRSNILLFKNEDVIDLFHNKLITDNLIKLHDLDRYLDQSIEAFELNKRDYRRLFPTFGKELNAYIAAQTAIINWDFIQQLLALLAEPTFYIVRWNYQLTLTLVPIGEILRQYTDPIAALNDFYINFQRGNVIDKEKGDVLRVLQKRIQRTQTYIEEAYQKLSLLDEGIKKEEIGHIIMANLHQIPERAETVVLFDFYRNKDIPIRLKPDLTPQRNAENYYRKAKNERIEIQNIEQNIEARAEELASMRQHFSTLENINMLKPLRNYIKANNLHTATTTATPSQLFKEVLYDDFVIWIGKNAKNNDLLTKKYTYKEDLWFHARDVAGSHVVLKYKSSKKFPNHVIERAAQLAAWYSKRRTDKLCPVIVTPKKYVRKPKGLPEGEVVIDKEEVIMVEPLGV